jgi:hypothetical protein
MIKQYKAALLQRNRMYRQLAGVRNRRAAWMQAYRKRIYLARQRELARLRAIKLRLKRLREARRRKKAAERRAVTNQINAWKRQKRASWLKWYRYRRWVNRYTRGYNAKCTRWVNRARGKIHYWRSRMVGYVRVYNRTPRHQQNRIRAYIRQARNRLRYYVRWHNNKVSWCNRWRRNEAIRVARAKARARRIYLAKMRRLRELRLRKIAISRVRTMRIRFYTWRNKFFRLQRQSVRCGVKRWKWLKNLDKRATWRLRSLHNRLRVIRLAMSRAPARFRNYYRGLITQVNRRRAYFRAWIRKIRIQWRRERHNYYARLRRQREAARRRELARLARIRAAMLRLKRARAAERRRIILRLNSWNRRFYLFKRRVSRKLRRATYLQRIRWIKRKVSYTRGAIYRMNARVRAIRVALSRTSKVNKGLYYRYIVRIRHLRVKVRARLSYYLRRISHLVRLERLIVKRIRAAAARRRAYLLRLAQKKKSQSLGWKLLKRIRKMEI